MVSVSGYRDEDALTIAYERLLTIIVGCVIALLVSILICPVWVGEDLQKLIAANLEKLGSFLEGMLDKLVTFSWKHEDNRNNFLLPMASLLLFYRI